MTWLLMEAESRRGQVVSLLANFCWVALEKLGPQGQERLLCTRRTRLGKSGQTICAGDWVTVESPDWPGARGVVAAVEPRGVLLERPPVANVTRVVVVVAVAEPPIDSLQLTRFLVTAEACGAAVELVFAKADLLPAAALEAWLERARGWGYEPMALSCFSGQGVAALQTRLSRPGLAVLCGPSGVGKSSLINAMVPDLALRIGAVSGRLQRGRHTTRHVELFPLADGALLADTPGFNRPDLPADPAALAALFPELRQRLQAGACRFKNCLHQGDPGCVAGVDWDRYSLYQSCLAAVLAQVERERERQPGSGAAGLKQRGHRHEPRLEERLRQPSRKRLRQSEARETDQAADALNPDPED